MKTTNGVIIGIVLVIVLILGISYYQKNNQNSTNSGNLIIGITDATAEISNVNDINLSIKKIEVYSQTKGWVTASSDTKSYKLLSLHANGRTELYTRAEVSEGTYNKVRVTLGDVVINTKTKGNVKATLPSKYVVINGNVKVKEGENSTVKLDILADQSLHTTVDGGYVFASRIKAESKSNANVSIGNDEVVLITNGSVDSETTVGVDFDGVSKLNFKAESDNSLKVESSINGETKFILGSKTYENNNVSEESDVNVNNNNSDGIDVKSNGSTDLNNNSKNKSVDVDLKGGIKIN